ncbi:MAG: hypothetical protein H6765_02545 [Candidatus Peribacteria bacterium]|nr:MAG: hypothetical protein H6765_02545 [Candidatus Peribacteria bacterium]
MGEDATEITVTLENGKKYRFELKAIEKEIRKHIPEFRFSTVREVDAKSLQKYLEKPELLQELDATFVRGRAERSMLAAVDAERTARETAAATASTRNLFERMYVDSGQLLTMAQRAINIPGLAALEKLEGLDVKAQRLDRDIQAKLAILRSEEATPERLAQHRTFLQKAFPQLIDVLKTYLTTAKSLLSSGRHLEPEDRDLIAEKLRETGNIIYSSFDTLEQLLRDLK